MLVFFGFFSKCLQCMFNSMLFNKLMKCMLLVIVLWKNVLCTISCVCLFHFYSQMFRDYLITIYTQFNSFECRFPMQNSILSNFIRCCGFCCCFCPFTKAINAMFEFKKTHREWVIINNNYILFNIYYAPINWSALYNHINETTIQWL